MPVAIAVAGAGLAMAPLAAVAELEIRTETTYYDIGGRTGKQLIEELQEKAPRAALDAKHYASATGLTTWDFNFVQEDGLCRLESVDVTLELTYEMPRWTERDKARRNVVRAWEGVIEALWQHERYHGELYQIGARSIHDSLLEHVDPAPECSSVADQFNRFARMQMREVDRAQVQFDMRTKIGDDAFLMGIGR